MPLGDWFERYGGVTPIDGNLHRSPLPYAVEHVRALKQAGIRVVYSMEEAVPGELLRQHGLDWRPHFWTDDQPPTPAQLERFLDDYLALPTSVPALVHCKAGWGRTGTAVTCALMRKHGWPADRALHYYWDRVPAAREVMEWNGQAEFVRGYGARLVGRGLP